MSLEWMGDYRGILESLIHYCNIYSSAYKPEVFEYKGVTYSFSLIQVVEYLIENEERDENMNAIAKRLGITRSSFTKITHKLEDKGLVRKTEKEGNLKEIYLVVTDFGRELYENYANIIFEQHFSKMFKEFDKIPKEYMEVFAKGLIEALPEEKRL